MKLLKTIVFTFDDGREDNYSVAFPIMKKYKLTGTIFITTGYIDGTWQKDESWKSAEKPLLVNQIVELKDNGWEIGLHGDRHITNYYDTQKSIEKMDKWIGTQNAYGFSMPNSVANKSELNDFINKSGSKIKYIRVGRKTNSHTFSSMLLYFSYRVLRIKKGYYLFNKNNINNLDNINRTSIFSIVVRKEDNPKMIVQFIKSLPTNCLIVFMFHSIIDKDSQYFNSDPWCWNASFFENFCKFVDKMRNENEIVVKKLEDVIQ